MILKNKLFQRNLKQRKKTLDSRSGKRSRFLVPRENCCFSLSVNNCIEMMDEGSVY